MPIVKIGKGKVKRFPYTKKGYAQAKALRKKLRKKRGRGVPAGYREIWGYKGVWDEKKLRKGLWKFGFKATKKRKSGSYGSFGKGTKGVWDIRGKQYIVKTGKGEYQTRLVGYKRPMKFKVRKPYKKRRY